MPTLDIDYLTEKTTQMRKDVLKSIHNASSKYIGGIHLIIDIIVSFLHTRMFRFYSTEPAWLGCDRFLLGKGHATIALYAVSADLGFFKKTELELLIQSRLLAEHPDRRIPDVKLISSSLGQYLPVSSGI